MSRCSTFYLCVSAVCLCDAFYYLLEIIRRMFIVYASATCRMSHGLGARAGSLNELSLLSGADSLRRVVR